MDRFFSVQSSKNFAGLCVAAAVVALLAPSAMAQPALQVGTDGNSADNLFVMSDDDPAPGNNRDQSMQFTDVLQGGKRADVLIGALGDDILIGGGGPDVLLGGTEDFNPINRDRAFGQRGSDIFIWSPGDGSDFFDGGPGSDAIIFGKVGEVDGDDVVFNVSTDQTADQVAISDKGFPIVDVTNSPGFCPVVDKSEPADEAELDALDLDHLVRFVIRGIRNSFEAGDQSDDNGLRVTVHMRNVEVLVCTAREGGAIEVLDLTQTPPVKISVDEIENATLRRRVRAMIQ